MNGISSSGVLTASENHSTRGETGGQVSLKDGEKETARQRLKGTDKQKQTALGEERTLSGALLAGLSPLRPVLPPPPRLRGRPRSLGSDALCKPPRHLAQLGTREGPAAQPGFPRPQTSPPDSQVDAPTCARTSSHKRAPPPPADTNSVLLPLGLTARHPGHPSREPTSSLSGGAVRPPVTSGWEPDRFHHFCSSARPPTRRTMFPFHVVSRLPPLTQVDGKVVPWSRGTSSEKAGVSPSCSG